MDLYNKIINIRGINYEEVLIKSISNVKEKLIGLTEERMCKVYSSYLLRELCENHVPARIIDTLNLGDVYEHVFILVPEIELGGGTY